MIIKTIFVLVMLTPRTLAGYMIPDDTGKRYGTEAYIQTMKRFDDAEACERGLRTYVEVYQKNHKPGWPSPIHLKCEPYQEITFEDQKKP